jgi:hypothetical protein
MPRTLQKRRSPAPAKRRSAPNVPGAGPGAGWTLRRTGGVQLLTADSLAALPWLVHGFSTRHGGASLLDGARVLNLGFTEWDARRRVTQNRLLFQRALGGARMPLLTLWQIHSDVAHLFATAPRMPHRMPQRMLNNDAPRGDAAITQQAGLLLGIQTADCVPILLVDCARRVVAAVHAGWRGTLARVVDKALGRMRLEFGTQPQEVIAAIGPAIGRCCYEVGPEVAQAFAGQFARAEEWIDGALAEEPNPLQWLNRMPPGHQPPPARVRLDLPAANRWQLASAGVLPRNISVSSLCTACRTDLLFSYRREGPGTGRMMAAIGVR